MRDNGALDNLQDLDMFRQILDSGSLSAAGRALGVHKNLISRRLRELETRLGVTLLRRTTRSLSPTPEGQLLYEGALRILEESRELQARITTETAPLRGELRVLVPSVAIQLGLVTSMMAALHRYPELTLHVDVSDEPMDPAQGGYDLVVYVGSPPDSTHIARPLTVLTPSLSAAPSYVARRGTPRTPEQLYEHDCLLFVTDQPQTHWRLVTSQGQEVVVPVRGRLLSRDSRLLRDALYRGDGIGVRPAAEVDHAVAEGQLVPILPKYRFEPLKVSALIPRGLHRSPRVRLVHEVLEGLFMSVV